jgi:ATP-dependent protease ClpP protease subunit
MWNKDKIDKILMGRTGMKLGQYRHQFGKALSKYFSAQEALEYGVIDEVLAHKVKTHPSLEEEKDKE